MIIDGNTEDSLSEINIQSGVDYLIEELVANPLNLKKIRRSRAGQGNDLQDCDEFENINIYIPKSG